MELLILTFLLVCEVFTFLFSKNNLPITWICIALLVISGTGIWMSGITLTSSVQATPSNYSCNIVTNCTNAINSTCLQTNVCANSFTDTPKVVVTKQDAQTVALGLIFVLVAVWLAIQSVFESLEFMKKVGGN